MEHEGSRDAELECTVCGAALRYVPIYEGGNLILVSSPPRPAP